MRSTADCESRGWGETKEEVARARGNPDKVVAAERNQEKWVYILPTRNRWCGVVVFAIVPLPLILPLCDESDNVEFAGEKVQKSYQTQLHNSGFLIAKGVDGKVESCSDRPPDAAISRRQPALTTRSTGLAGVLEQEPKSAGKGCAPYNARVGDVYAHEGGASVTVQRLLGESEFCPLPSRPIAVEFDSDH